MTRFQRLFEVIGLNYRGEHRDDGRFIDCMANCAEAIRGVVLAAEGVINNCPAAYGAQDDRRCVTEHEARLQTALNALAEKLESK